jgi:hypothetical protein
MCGNDGVKHILAEEGVLLWRVLGRLSVTQLAIYNIYKVHPH